MGFKFAKKIKKKTNSSSAPPQPTKKLFGLRIRKKHTEFASAESKLRFLSTSGGRWKGSCL